MLYQLCGLCSGYSALPLSPEGSHRLYKNGHGVFQLNFIYETGQGQMWPRRLLTPALGYCFIGPGVNLSGQVGSPKMMESWDVRSGKSRL